MQLLKGRQYKGAPSVNDPYAWATHALKNLRPQWGGDRHKDDLKTGGKWFPKGTGEADRTGWGVGAFSRGGEGAALRDQLVKNVIPAIISEHGWSEEGFVILMKKAEDLLYGKATARKPAEKPKEGRKKLPFMRNMIEKAAKPAVSRDLLEEQEEEVTEDELRAKKHAEEAQAAMWGEGNLLGGGGYGSDIEKPDVSGETVATYYEDPSKSKKAHKPWEPRQVKMEKDMELRKLSPDLARLMAAAVGWATSDDLVRSGGGSPRGERTAAEESQWQDALRRHEKREEEERRRHERRQTTAERRRMMRTRKSMDIYPEFDRLNMFWGNLSKDHAPVPPRQGLVWDAVKHKWVRPENHGHSVSEVQGGKRFRGHGTGVHERKVGGHGTGPIRRLQEGRRFRGTTDTGVSRPHEATHPAQRYLSRKGASSPKLQRRRRVKRFK